MVAIISEMDLMSVPILTWVVAIVSAVRGRRQQPSRSTYSHFKLQEIWRANIGGAAY